MTDDVLDLEALRRAARTAGFDWADSNLEPLLPLATPMARALRTLEATPVDAAEPAIVYRVV